MSPEEVERAAGLIHAARVAKRATLLPDECRPRSLDEAYAIQDRVTALLDLPLAGWKVGATAPAVAKAEGASSPVAGRLFTPHVHRAPATLAAGRFTSFRNCEVEFVLHVMKDLPPRPGGYERAPLEAAIGALSPAIEIGDSRLSDRASAGIVAVCADNSGGTELVLGETTEHWLDWPLARHEVALRLNGATVATGSGADVMGDPVASLAWLVSHCSARGETIPAGSIVATGSCTGINIAAAGDVAEADFGALGIVSVTFGVESGRQA